MRGLRRLSAVFLLAASARAGLLTGKLQVELMKGVLQLAGWAMPEVGNFVEYHNSRRENVRTNIIKCTSAKPYWFDMHADDMAVLANEAYYPPGERLREWNGYKRLTYKTAVDPYLGLGDTVIGENNCALYIKRHDAGGGQLVVSFRGTLTKTDWLVNYDIMTGSHRLNERFKQAKGLMKILVENTRPSVDRNLDIVLTGHSQGGTLALEVSNNYKYAVRNATVFNPGLSYRDSDLEIYPDWERNHFVVTPWDVVSMSLFPVSAINGALKCVDKGIPTGVTAVLDRHSMHNFLAAEYLESRKTHEPEGDCTAEQGGPKKAPTTTAQPHSAGKVTVDDEKEESSYSWQHVGFQWLPLFLLILGVVGSIGLMSCFSAQCALRCRMCCRMTQVADCHRCCGMCKKAPKKVYPGKKSVWVHNIPQRSRDGRGFKTVRKIFTLQKDMTVSQFLSNIGRQHQLDVRGYDLVDSTGRRLGPNEQMGALRDTNLSLKYRDTT